MRFSPISHRFARNRRRAHRTAAAVFPKISLFLHRPTAIRYRGGQWSRMCRPINLALSGRRCLVARILTPGVKRPRTRHCSMADPSHGSVTPVLLIYQVTGAPGIGNRSRASWRNAEFALATARTDILRWASSHTRATMVENSLRGYNVRVSLRILFFLS